MTRTQDQDQGPMTAPILFDGSVLSCGPVTGVGRSFLNTLAAYLEIASRPCVLLATPELHEDTVAIPGLPIARVLPNLRVWRRGAIRRAVRRTGASLLHSPVVALPAKLRCPTIATVHDLPWLHPELRGEPGSRHSQRRALRFAARRATALIVPSAATGQDLDRLTGVVSRTPERVTIIPHGVPPAIELPPATSLVGAFLVLGDDRPRKNLARVHTAHAAARQRCPDLPDLRFVGPPDDFVSEAEKLRILRQSRALLHFSLLEGFGLPIVEAFAHGVPVVCSNRTSLPEVAGDAAILVDPTDISAMAAAIVRVHEDPERRQQLRDRGLRRAAMLTPQRTAEAWYTLHESLLA